jgi:hypothetical protein
MPRIGSKYNETMSVGLVSDGKKAGKLERDFRFPAELQTRYPSSGTRKSGEKNASFLI